MSLLEEIVVRCTEIEQHLRSLGATGSGLAELLESNEGALRREHLSGIRNLASVRNRFVHEHGYVYPDSYGELLMSADTILMELRKQVGRTNSSTYKPSPERTSNPSDRNFQKERPMPASNPWVKILLNPSPVLSIPSTDMLRLVLFKNGFPVVCPIGDRHTVPFFGVRRLALVSMGTAVTTFQLTAATRDQIELALTIDITARINPTDYAIASIASDASDDTSKQLRELETRIAHSLQEIVSKILFEDIPDVSSLQSRLVGLISEPLVGHALIVDLLTVRSLAPTNPEIKSHSLDRLRLQKRAALRVEEEAAENRRREAERVQKAWETTQQREAHEWEQKQAKLRRQEEDSRDQAKHSRDLQLSQTEQKFQIELAKIKRDERLAALKQGNFEKWIPRLIKITTQDGYKDGLIDALAGSQRISINSIRTVVPDPTPSIDAPPQTSPDDATDE